MEPDKLCPYCPPPPPPKEAADSSESDSEGSATDDSSSSSSSDNELPPTKPCPNQCKKWYCDAHFVDARHTKHCKRLPPPQLPFDVESAGVGLATFATAPPEYMCFSPTDTETPAAFLRATQPFMLWALRRHIDPATVLGNEASTLRNTLVSEDGSAIHIDCNRLLNNKTHVYGTGQISLRVRAHARDRGREESKEWLPSATHFRLQGKLQSPDPAVYKCTIFPADRTEADITAFMTVHKVPARPGYGSGIRVDLRFDAESASEDRPVWDQILERGSLELSTVASALPPEVRALVDTAFSTRSMLYSLLRHASNWQCSAILKWWRKVAAWSPLAFTSLPPGHDLYIDDSPAMHLLLAEHLGQSRLSLVPTIVVCPGSDKFVEEAVHRANDCFSATFDTHHFGFDADVQSSDDHTVVMMYKPPAGNRVFEVLARCASIIIVVDKSKSAAKKVAKLCAKACRPEEGAADTPFKPARLLWSTENTSAKTPEGYFGVVGRTGWSAEARADDVHISSPEEWLCATDYGVDKRADADNKIQVDRDSVAFHIAARHQLDEFTLSSLDRLSADAETRLRDLHRSNPDFKRLTAKPFRFTKRGAVAALRLSSYDGPITSDLLRATEHIFPMSKLIDTSWGLPVTGAPAGSKESKGPRDDRVLTTAQKIQRHPLFAWFVEHAIGQDDCVGRLSAFQSALESWTAPLLAVCRLRESFLKRNSQNVWLPADLENTPDTAKLSILDGSAFARAAVQARISRAQRRHEDHGDPKLAAAIDEWLAIANCADKADEVRLAAARSVCLWTACQDVFGDGREAKGSRLNGEDIVESHKGMLEVTLSQFQRELLQVSTYGASEGLPGSWPMGATAAPALAPAPEPTLVRPPPVPSRSRGGAGDAGAGADEGRTSGFGSGCGSGSGRGSGSGFDSGSGPGSGPARAVASATAVVRLGVAMSKTVQSFEIINGDAMTFNENFVAGILEGTRPLVVAVIGGQSCGKSTVLNGIGGMDCATSMGMCTRGVYGALLPLARHIGTYDSILFLDVEGIAGDSSSASRDGQIMQMVMASSDVIIMCNAGSMTRGQRFAKLVEHACVECSKPRHALNSATAEAGYGSAGPVNVAPPHVCFLFNKVKGPSAFAAMGDLTQRGAEDSLADVDNAYDEISRVVEGQTTDDGVRHRGWKEKLQMMSIPMDSVLRIVDTPVFAATFTTDDSEGRAPFVQSATAVRGALLSIAHARAASGVRALAGETWARTHSGMWDVIVSSSPWSDVIGIIERKAASRLEELSDQFNHSWISEHLKTEDHMSRAQSTDKNELAQLIMDVESRCGAALEAAAEEFESKVKADSGDLQAVCTRPDFFKRSYDRLRQSLDNALSNFIGNLKHRKFRAESTERRREQRDDILTQIASFAGTAPSEEGKLKAWMKDLNTACDKQLDAAKEVLEKQRTAEKGQLQASDWDLFEPVVKAAGATGTTFEPLLTAHDAVTALADMRSGDDSTLWCRRYLFEVTGHGKGSHASDSQVELLLPHVAQVVSEIHELVAGLFEVLCAVSPGQRSDVMQFARDPAISTLGQCFAAQRKLSSAVRDPSISQLRKFGEFLISWARTTTEDKVAALKARMEVISKRLEKRLPAVVFWYVLKAHESHCDAAYDTGVRAAEATIERLKNQAQTSMAGCKTIREKAERFAELAVDAWIEHANSEYDIVSNCDLTMDIESRVLERFNEAIMGGMSALDLAARAKILGDLALASTPVEVVRDWWRQDAAGWPKFREAMRTKVYHNYQSKFKAVLDVAFSNCAIAVEHGEDSGRSVMDLVERATPPASLLQHLGTEVDAALAVCCPDAEYVAEIPASLDEDERQSRDNAKKARRTMAENFRTVVSLKMREKIATAQTKVAKHEVNPSTRWLDSSVHTLFNNIESTCLSNATFLRAWARVKICGAACPFCHALCTLGHGHAVNQNVTEPAKKHDTKYHAYAALRGLRSRETELASTTTCTQDECWTFDYITTEDGTETTRTYEEYIAYKAADWLIQKRSETAVQEQTSLLWGVMKDRMAEYWGYKLE